MHITRRLLTPATLLAVVALIGCGGSDEPSADDAKSDYGPIQSRLSDLGDSIGRELLAARGRGDAALQRAFGQLQQRGQDAAERIQNLEVPDELADQRDALRDAIDRGSDDLGKIVDAVRSSDVDAAREAVQQLGSDSRTISQARASFERALDAATR